MMVEAGDGSPTWVRALDQGSSALAVFFFLRLLSGGSFLKSLLNLSQYCFYVLFYWPCFGFMFCFFGHEAGGILAPRPGIEPMAPAFEGEVLITGLAGKSLAYSVIHFLELKRRFGLF